MKFILIADDDEKRIRFFPLWEVLIYTIFVACILVLLFPRHLLHTVLLDEQPDTATLAYLKIFREYYPQNQQILFSIIEQDIGLGQIPQAEKELAMLKKNLTAPSVQTLTQIRWMEYLLLRYHTFQTRINSPERISYLKKLRPAAMALADAPLNPYQLRLLAKDNIGIGQVNVALKIYDRLMAMHALTTPKELAEGGSIAMQNNAHRDAARFYWAAYNKSTTMPEKRQYALDTIKVLWAANLPQEGLMLAEQLPNDVINDREILLYLTRLAIAANRPDLAQKYALKVLLMK